MFVKCLQLLTHNLLTISLRSRSGAWMSCLISSSLNIRSKLHSLHFDKELSESGSMSWYVCISTIDPNIQHKLYHKTSESLYSDVVYTHKYELKCQMAKFQTFYFYFILFYWTSCQINLPFFPRSLNMYVCMCIYIYIYIYIQGTTGLKAPWDKRRLWYYFHLIH